MELIITLVVGLFTLTANTLTAVLFYNFKRMDTRIGELEKDMDQIRLNYLDRFADLKDTIKSFELTITQRISILETLLQEHFIKINQK